MLNFLTCSHFSTWVYIQETTAFDHAEAIIKCSCAISASSVAVWEPGLC